MPDTETFTVLTTGNHQWGKHDVRMPPGGKTTLITQKYKKKCPQLKYK